MRHPEPQWAKPIRIAKHAFEPGKPARDLVVLPGHALCVEVVDELLVPAHALINDATVVQLDVATVTCWHVELETHDLPVANGLPSESYFDTSDRAFFVENGVVALDGRPDATRDPANIYCRPFSRMGRSSPQSTNACAEALGWRQAATPLNGLHLVADGARIEPDSSGTAARFVVPASANDVWLVSDSYVPYHLGQGDDRRRFGVSIARHDVALDDPRLVVGFFDEYAGMDRWTTGRAHLPATLWVGCRGPFFLCVKLATASGARWVAPAVDAMDQAAAAA